MKEVKKGRKEELKKMRREGERREDVSNELSKTQGNV